MLMVISVALMITPGTYHRIVEGGRDSGAFHKVTSVIADLSLLPFALAPDLYKGRLTTVPDEANHLMSGLDFPDATHQDLRGAAQHLKSSSGKVAVMGFCMGGALTIAAAVHVPEAAAAVCFYGIPPKEFADPARLKIPFQGHFANQDDWCTPAAVDELEKALKSAAATYEIYRYDAAHAFFNERSPAYDLASANQAWDRMLGFLEKRL